MSLKLVSRVFLLPFLVGLAPGVLSTTDAFDQVEYTEAPFTLGVVDGPNDDETNIMEARILIPETATPLNPAPAVIVAHPFSDDVTNSLHTLPFARQWASAGYVAIAYSARGFGGSTGDIGLNSVDYDVKQVRQLIDHVATLPFVALDSPGDPRVGMDGWQYGGSLGLLVATQDARVDAVVAMDAWASLVDGLSPQTAMIHESAPFDPPFGVIKTDWMNNLFARGTAEVLVSPEGSRFPPTAICGFVQPVCETIPRLNTTGRFDQEAADLLAKSSPLAYHSSLHVPTLIVQGERDGLFDLNEGIRNFEAAKGTGAPAKMVWHAGGTWYAHKTYNELSTSKVPNDAIRSRILRWFHRHLRPDTNVDTGPELEYHAPWIADDDARATYESAEQYPVFGTTTFHLSADGTMTTDRSAAVEGDLRFVNPPGGVPAAVGAQSATLLSMAVPSEPREIVGQHLSWTSDAFSQPVTLLGTPTIQLPITSASTLGAAYFTKIYDVAPDGTATLIHRHVGAVWVDDTEYPTVSRHPALVHRFEPGHSVRLVVASTDLAFANRRVPDVYTVSAGADATLGLPISQ